MILNQNKIQSNKALETSIKEDVNNPNFIKNLDLLIDIFNKTNFLKRNNYEEDLIPPSKIKRIIEITKNEKRRWNF